MFCFRWMCLFAVMIFMYHRETSFLSTLYLMFYTFIYRFGVLNLLEMKTWVLSWLKQVTEEFPGRIMLNILHNCTCCRTIQKLHTNYIVVQVFLHQIIYVFTYFMSENKRRQRHKHHDSPTRVLSFISDINIAAQPLWIRFMWGITHILRWLISCWKSMILVLNMLK